MSKVPNQPVKKLPPRPPQVVFKPEDYARSNVPLYQIQQLKEAFDLFDIHRHGKIDPKQLRNALNICNMEAKNGTFYHAVTSVQKEGPIDFSKFLEVMSARSGLQKTRNNMKKVFANFDEEKTGFISQKNLKKIIKDVGITGMNDKDISQMIQKADLDNDGLVSEEQFYLIMTKKSRKL